MNAFELVPVMNEIFFFRRKYEPSAYRFIAYDAHFNNIGRLSLNESPLRMVRCAKGIPSTGWGGTPGWLGWRLVGGHEHREINWKYHAAPNL